MSISTMVVLDVGGTKVQAGLCRHNIIVRSVTEPFNASGSAEQISTQLIELIAKFVSDDCQAIALGVPAIVDIEQGIILDAVNIEAWQSMSFKAILEQYFSLPVYINNDVNCFTIGEFVLNNSEPVSDLVGICLGTGFGVGMVLNKQLYAGQNCSAGEFGSIRYLDGTFDDYCSGQFFERFYHKSGAELAMLANKGDENALQAFAQFGRHLAQVFSILLLVLDPQRIVLGGSVAKSYDFFKDALWRELEHYPYQSVIKNLTVSITTTPNSALVGAAYLCANHLALT